MYTRAGTCAAVQSGEAEAEHYLFTRLLFDLQQVALQTLLHLPRLLLSCRLFWTQPRDLHTHQTTSHPHRNPPTHTHTHTHPHTHTQLLSLNIPQQQRKPEMKMTERATLTLPLIQIGRASRMA